MLPLLLLAAVTSAAPATPLPAPGAPHPGSAAATEVRIRTPDDLVLLGDYLAPRKKSDLAPGVLLVHSDGGDRSQLTDLAERLHKLGFGTLTLDLRGHGMSRSQDIDWEKLDSESRKALWALAIRDVEAAARWLLSQEGIHSTNLSLVGYGAGCALAVRHATRDENVRAVALLAPNPKEFGFDVESDIREIGGLPTLVLSPRDAKKTERMVSEANSVAHPYIELLYSSAKSDLLEDKKLPSKVSSWLKDVAMPKRGRG